MTITRAKQAEERAREQDRMAAERERMAEDIARTRREAEDIAAQDYEMRQFYESVVTPFFSISIFFLLLRLLCSSFGFVFVSVSFVCWVWGPWEGVWKGFWKGERWME